MDRAERLRQVRERLAMDELAPVAIGPEEGASLREWVRRESARQTLETGLGFAVSTLFVCEGLLANGGEVSHVAIDPYLPDSHVDEGLRALEEAGVRELVEFYAQGSGVVLPRLLVEGRTKAAKPSTSGSSCERARRRPTAGRSTTSRSSRLRE